MGVPVGTHGTCPDRPVLACGQLQVGRPHANATSGVYWRCQPDRGLCDHRVSQAGLQLACGLTALIIECLVVQSCCHATIGTGGDTGSVCTDPWWFDPGRGGTMPVTGLPAEGSELQSVYTRG